MTESKAGMSRRRFLASSAVAGVATLGIPSVIAGIPEANAKAKKEQFTIYFNWDRPIYPDVKPKYIFRMGHCVPSNVYTSSQHTQSVIFKNILERNTKGEIRVDIVPAWGLGNGRQMIQQTKEGTVQGCIIPEGFVPVAFPEYNVLSIPFVFKTPAVAWHVLDGPFGKALSTEVLNRLGMRIIALGENGGFRNFINKTKPIHSASDVSGLKYRVQPSEGPMAFVRALGGNPHPIPMTEVYVALQTNVIDGCELPISVINMFKIYEVTKYLTLDAHIYGVDTFFMNNAWFMKLPKDLKDLIIEAGYQTTIASRGTNRVQLWEVLAKIEDRMEEIYIPTNKEREEYAKITQPAYLDWYHSKIDKKQKWSTLLFENVKKAEEFIWGDNYIYG
jgi:tripartite ATP-independent transporter DctP family solute receptor